MQSVPKEIKDLILDLLTVREQHAISSLNAEFKGMIVTRNVKEMKKRKKKVEKVEKIMYEETLTEDEKNTIRTRHRKYKRTVKYIRDGDLYGVIYMIHIGKINVNYMLNHAPHNSYLYISIISSRYDIARYLMGSGVNFTIYKFPFTKSLLEITIDTFCKNLKKTDIKFLEHILENGGDPNSRPYEFADTVFINTVNKQAILFTDNPDTEVLYDILKTLIKYGADVNAKGHEGKTALHRTLCYDNNRLLKILIDNGANVDGVDDAFNTPLHYACGYDNKEAMKMLIKTGAKTDIVNKIGNLAHESKYVPFFGLR